MDRLILAAAVLIVVLCALLIASPGVLTGSQINRSDPVSIALADPDVHDSVLRHDGEVSVGNVTSLDENTSGFIGLTDKLVKVPVKTGSMWTSERFVVYVDIDRGETVGGEWYSYRNLPASAEVTIPLGASWYYTLYGPVYSDSGTEAFMFHVRGIEPSDSMVVPLVVDEENLLRMKNGCPYEAAEYSDTFTNQQAILNGTARVFEGWALNASVQRPAKENATYWPAFDTSRRHYLVLRNVGDEEAKVVLGTP